MECGQIYLTGTVLGLTAVLFAVCSAFSERVCSHYKQLEIQTVGYRPVAKGDIALVLYADIFNNGNLSLHMKINVKKCCLFLPEEKYCKGMKLLGNHQGDIQPKKLKQFNFVYPTLYPYDRVGECELLVSANTCDMSYRKVTIPFNTRVPRDWWTDWLPRSVQTVLFGVGVRDCRGVDEDRLRSCAPVNCRLKYGGTRNFFNSTEKQCMEVPKCATQLYDPVNNDCRESTDRLPKEMYARVLIKSSLHATVEEDTSPNWRTLVGPRLDCGHGQMSHDHLDCQCDPHWTTGTKESIGQREITMMCNVANKVPKTTNTNIILVFVFSVFFLLVAMAICLYMRARGQAQCPYQLGTCPCTTENDSCLPKLHSHWKPSAGTSKETSHMTGHMTDVGQTTPLAAAEEDSQDEI